MRKLRKLRTGPSYTLPIREKNSCIHMYIVAVGTYGNCLECCISDFLFYYSIYTMHPHILSQFNYIFLMVYVWWKASSSRIVHQWKFCFLYLHVGMYNCIYSIRGPFLCSFTQSVSVCYLLRMHHQLCFF